MPARPRRRVLAATTVLAAVLTTGAVTGPVAGGHPSASAGAGTACPAAPTTAVRSAPGAGRTVALTFDDGPGPYTPQVLEILRTKGVRATFFVLGQNVPLWPAYAKQVVAEGHQIGNHTQSHPDLTTLSAAGQAAELDRATTALRTATGVTPCALRPPFGSYNATTVSVARARGMKTVHWTTDSYDWAQPTAPSAAGRSEIVRRANLGSAYSHPVVLFHDGGHQRPNLVTALPAVIDHYRSRGYRFVDLRGGSGLRAKPAVVDWRRSPTGHVDAFRGGAGRVTVVGWTFDPDAPTAPLTVEVRVSGVVHGRAVADVHRADVQKAFPSVGGSHGFAVTVPAGRGARAVCVTAVNRGAGALGGLGCAPVTVG